MIRVRKLYIENFLREELAKHPLRYKLQRSYDGHRKGVPVLHVSSKRKPKGFVVQRTEYREQSVSSWLYASLDWKPVDVYDVYSLDGLIRATGIQTLKKALNICTMS